MIGTEPQPAANGRPQVELPLTEPDIFAQDAAPHVQKGVAEGLSRMWEGKRMWESYRFSLGEEIQARLRTKSSSEDEGQEPEGLDIVLNQGDKRRFISAELKTTRFQDPMLNTSEYDRAPRYPENAKITRITDDRQVLLP